MYILQIAISNRRDQTLTNPEVILAVRWGLFGDSRRLYEEGVLEENVYLVLGPCYVHRMMNEEVFDDIGVGVFV